MPKPIHQNDDTPRQRGAWLTLYLILPLLIVAINFTMLGIDFFFGAIRRYTDIPFIQASYVITTFVCAIFLLVGVFGTWRWKRWGVFGLVGGMVLFGTLMVVDFFDFGSNAFFDVADIVTGLYRAFREAPINVELIVFVVFLVIAGVPLWLILRSKWALFE